MKRLLFVHHTVSPAMHALYLAAFEGAHDPAIEGIADLDAAENRSNQVPGA